MLKRIALILCVALVAMAAGDYLLFAINLHRGKATSTVDVQQYLETPLKGNKAEYDYLGTDTVPCVHALLPHQHTSPCWWVERHKEHWVS